MRSLSGSLILAVILASGVANAGEKLGIEPVFHNGALSLGDAADQIVLFDDYGFQAGLMQPIMPRFMNISERSSLKMGGFLGWNGSDYRIAAGLHPGDLGSVSAVFGIIGGAEPNNSGFSYGVQLGIELTGDRFSVNPENRLGYAYGDHAPEGLDVLIGINHSFTPNLLAGARAEARTRTDATQQTNAPRHELMFGAGFDIRF